MHRLSLPCAVALFMAACASAGDGRHADDADASHNGGFPDGSQLIGIDAGPNDPDATPPPDAQTTIDAAPPPPDATPVPTELGRIGYWFGKVNTHRGPLATDAWTWDTDCSSGANLDPLTYCRKFFPATSSITQVPVSSKPVPVWQEGGCFAVHPGDGETEYVCNP
jgi:hypothetical protein